MQEWQHIPETIDPIAFSIGFFSVRWYALWFLAGFFVTLQTALSLVRRGHATYSTETIFDVSLFIFFGALIGGHIGYIALYNLGAFLENPLAMLMPYDFANKAWVGISGMSYHGGLIGAALSLLWFARRKKIDFWRMADLVALVTPMAIFFGRLGNFFNIELYGRVTEQPWGMVFPGVFPAEALRHPSVLYEALLEGVVLFMALMLLRRKDLFPGMLVCAFLAGYAVLRFIAEYFREPDPQIGFLFGTLTLGQILSLALLFASLALFLWLRRKNRATMISIV